MDFHSEATRMVNELKVPLKTSSSRRQLIHEIAFWGSLYNVQWPNEGIKKEVYVMVELNLDQCRKLQWILRGRSFSE